MMFQQMLLYFALEFFTVPYKICVLSTLVVMFSGNLWSLKHSLFPCKYFRFTQVGQDNEYSNLLGPLIKKTVSSPFVDKLI